ncbi:MAG TPA: S9 family peptidase [Chitinophagaceae bacterium]|nr:S9 family peptidase [Chitinophagaceae bacterium]
MQKKIQWALVLLLSSISLAVSAQNKRNLQPGDIYRLPGVGGGQISPDGNWVLYSISTPDSAKDNRKSDLWMMSWDGVTNLQLTYTPEGEGAPRWSPDGKFISFITARNGGTSQVYVLNRMGGEAYALTNVKGELQTYEWSPDGSRLALLVKDAEDTSRQKKNEPWVIDRYQFKQDVQGYLYDKRKTHIYLFDVKDKKIDTLTSGQYDEESIKWSPDGTQLAFVSNRTADPDKNSNDDIYIIEAKKGAVMRQLTTWKGTDGSPQWSPDGKTIAYIRSSSEDAFNMYDQPVLCLINSSGGEPRLLSASLDRTVTSPRFSKDGKEVAVIVGDDCTRYIGIYNIASGAFSGILKEEHSVGSLELHPNGNWLASISQPHLPAELFAVENGVKRRLTKVQDAFLAPLQLGSVQKIVSTSKDGTKVSNLLFLPPGSEGKKLPAIFFIHGGPVAQDEFGFDLTRQMLAAKGYAVIAVNYRGSSGRGAAFCKAIYADWGNKEVMDILGAADHFIKAGIIDADKIGIGGWSYGGILTNYSIASDSRFKAACSGAGSALQLSLYGVDQYIRQLDNEIGPPWKNNNYQKYLKLSYPFLNAEKIKTPTLFLTGEKDFNVPAIGSEQMYQALRSNGIPTGLIIYPGQFHGLTKPSYIKDRLERYQQWYDKYIKGTGN